MGTGYIPEKNPEMQLMMLSGGYANRRPTQADPNEPVIIIGRTDGQVPFRGPDQKSLMQSITKQRQPKPE